MHFREQARVVPSASLYKYVPMEWTEAFERGSIRIGTLLDYRTMEGPRGDPFEGAAINRTGTAHFDYIGAHHTQTRAMLNEFDIDVIESTNGTISGFERQYDAEDHYIYCLTDDASYKPDKPHRMYKLSDLGRFIETITSLSPALSSVETSMVTYGKRESDVFRDGFLAADPFLKPKALSWEKEARIAWKGRKGLSLEPIIVEHTAIRDLFEYIHRPEIEGQANSDTV